MWGQELRGKGGRGQGAGGRGQEPMKKGEIWDKIGQTEDGRQEFMRKEATIN